jgi:hypothetical protein
MYVAKAALQGAVQCKLRKLDELWVSPWDYYRMRNDYLILSMIYGYLSRPPRNPKLRDSRAIVKVIVVKGDITNIVVPVDCLESMPVSVNKDCQRWVSEQRSRNKTRL